MAGEVRPGEPPHLYSSSLYIIVDEEYDITVASFGLGTGRQNRIVSDCGTF